jgi:hypothetical protein
MRAVRNNFKQIFLIFMGRLKFVKKADMILSKSLQYESYIILKSYKTRQLSNWLDNSN